MSPDHLICFLCFYGRQADKSARPIGWLGSCVRKYCLLGAGKVLWKNFEPFWRHVTSKIVFSSCSCLYIAMNDCLLLPMFPWTPIVQTSAANWLTRFKWQNIVNLRQGKYYEKISSRFWENISSNRITYKLIPRFRHINCFLLSLFLWTPGWQTSAANWLTRFMWKEILSTLPRESIMKKFRAILEKYNI